MIGAKFTCNICGMSNTFTVASNWRETPSCTCCGSNVRYRSLIHALLTRLLGAPKVLADIDHIPARGLGLTDAPGYAERLAKVFDYTNTYYHQEPLLDISAPAPHLRKRADFLISSDVFEHVPPPAQRAFDGAAAVLRPGGILVLTVPFGFSETVEHFPNLHEFRVVELGAEWVLVNRDEFGCLSVHESLVFHGGPGTTLEMRCFGLQNIIRHLEAAGFGDIQVHGEQSPEWGIFLENSCSVPITAIAP